MSTTPKKVLMLTSALAVVLAAILAALLIMVGYRTKLVWEAPVGGTLNLSERTREILAESQGSIRISCFMDRRHPMFRPVSRLLRGIQQAAHSTAGAEITIVYIDPRWDLASSARLVANGVPENALLFESRRRRVVVTLDDMLTQRSVMRANERKPEPNGYAKLGVFRGEMVCAAAVARLVRPHKSLKVYWMLGHGEVSFDSYDDLRGFSDIAREIKRDGFDLHPLHLAGMRQIPEECQALIIAGMKYAMTAPERKVVDDYLRKGGRLLFLTEPGSKPDVFDILLPWGIRVTPFVAMSKRTLSGTDVVADQFADHLITRNLQSSSVVFGRALCLEAVESGPNTSADLPKVTMLVKTDHSGWGEKAPEIHPAAFDARIDLNGPVALAAISERGGDVSSDIHFRPTRICVFGETDFVMNGALSNHANANRDLFMNALYWLTGIDTGTAPSIGGDAVLVTGFTRDQWIRFHLLVSLLIPLVFALVTLLYVLKQRR